MHQAPISSKPVTVTIAAEPRVLLYDKLAEYRMSTLPRPSSVRDFLQEGKSFAALVNWTWACMTGKDALFFLTPESLVNLIDEKNTEEIFKAVYTTWKAAQPPDDNSPLASGSGTGPLPASS